MDLDDLLARIEEALDEEEWEEALGMVEEGLALFPDSGWLHAYLGETHAALGDVDRATSAYRRAVELEPGCAEFHETVADFFLRLGRFQEAGNAAEEALRVNPEATEALDILAYVAERDGDTARAGRLLTRAREIDPDVAVPVRLDTAEFRAQVNDALERLPDEFQAALRKNLAIVVEPFPSMDLLRDTDPPLDPTILGFYSGVPLPEREDSQAPPPLPDVIYLFQRNIEHICETREALVDEIATTLYHEIAHYFGFEEDEMESLGLE